MFWLQMIAHFICCISKPCKSISARYISILYAHSLPTFVVDHLHTNIHQQSWKLLEINPTTMLDVSHLWFYAGIDGVILVLNSHQQNLMWNKFFQDTIQVHKLFQAIPVPVNFCTFAVSNLPSWVTDEWNGRDSSPSCFSCQSLGFSYVSTK